MWCGGEEMVRLLLCLLFHVVSSSQSQGHWSAHDLDAALHYYDTLHVDDISHTSPAQHHHELQFSTLGRDFHLVLQWDRNILARDFRVRSVDAKGREHVHPVRPQAFLLGHLKGMENSSIITAHLSHDRVLSAVIATPTGTYHVEPSQHYISQPHPFHMVAYTHSHVKQRLNSTRFDYATPPVAQTGFFNKQHIRRKSNGVKIQRLKRQAQDEPESSCNLVLIADTSAYRLFGSSVSSTSSQLVLLVSSLDKMIYRPTKWLIDVNNNTFSNLGHSIQEIIVHEEYSDDPMNYNFNDPSLSAGAVLGLMRFGPWSDYCLAHLFTNRQFPGGLLGLANIASPLADQTGGICSEEFRDFSFSPPRSIIFNTGVSTYNNAGQRMVLSEMIRVTGHELGHNWGSHHDPTDPECSNFLMNEFAQDGSVDTHSMFSNCSSRSVGNVLLTKANCFRDSLCGNFFIDGNETCDAGTEGDACCTPQCTLQQTANCSDVNSLCCDNCRPAPSTVECRGPIRVECADRTFCNGTGFDCPAESPPAPVNSSCLRGVCLVGENGGRPRCVSVCEMRGLEQCSCESEMEECLVCCREGASCVSTGTPLADGSFCQDGVCINGTCTDRVQDTIERFWDIISNLDSSAFAQFLAENIVGWILIFTIPVWCLCSYVVHRVVDRPGQEMLENLDMAKMFVAPHRRRRHSFSKGDPGETMELLLDVESPPESPPVEPVDEPVDDLPLPETRRTYID